MQVMPNMRICPTCGSRTFSSTPPVRNLNTGENADLGIPSSQISISPIIYGPSQDEAMANEYSNVPLPTPTHTSIPEKKSSTWGWLWMLIQVILGVILVKAIGLVGALTAIGCYNWLKPKLGTWGAIAASCVISTLVAIGLSEIILTSLSHLINT
jgi:hypothetical protein